VKRAKARPLTRQETKERTREALLRAGMELFAEQGLDGPSLDAICDHAGFTRGAFYVHFKDREDFLVAVMDAVGVEFLDFLTGADPGQEGDFTSMAARFLQSFAEGGYPLGPAGGIRPHQLLDACARSERVRARYAALVSDAIGRVATLIRRDQEGKKIRPDIDPRALAAVLLAAVIGAQTMIELEVPMDLGHAALTLQQMMQPR
jgi:TetR/AcrR family transcriptional regulator, transcriptional repressor for nem operon